MVVEYEYKEVCQLLDKGAKLYVARDATGKTRLKFKTGPFGFFTKRYTLDPSSMDKLRLQYHLDRV